MAEQTTPTTTTTESTSTPSSTEGKAKIQLAATGGGFSFDEFNRVMGRETDQSVEDDSEPEVEEGTGELLDPSKDEESEEKEESDGSEEEGDEESSEESDEEDSEEEVELEDLGKGLKKGSGVKAVTKDGKEVTLPPDLEIVQMVDGEPRKINLREHLNVVAGELTVESRLGKISSFRAEVEKRKNEIEAIHTDFQTKVRTLVDFAAQGKPEMAICYLAELNNTSPIQMKKQFLQTLVAEAQRFEGKSEVEIENYYLRLEQDWQRRKAQAESEKLSKQEKVNAFIHQVTEDLKKENISPDEFSETAAALQKAGKFDGLSQQEKIDLVIGEALYVKHEKMSTEALNLVDPKYANNKQLRQLLMEFTHPNKFTVEDMAEVVKEYLRTKTSQLASSLSKKATGIKKPVAQPEKQNGAGKKQKAFKSPGDLARAFGL